MTDAQRGFYHSDRCQFCQDFGEKVKPFLCGRCWNIIEEEYVKPSLDKLTAEVARLKGILNLKYDPDLIDKISKGKDRLLYNGESYAPVSELTALESERERLREAIKKYGDHVSLECPELHQVDKQHECVCGFTRLINFLAPAQPRGEA